MYFQTFYRKRNWGGYVRRNGRPILSGPPEGAWYLKDLILNSRANRMWREKRDFLSFDPVEKSQQSASFRKREVILIISWYHRRRKRRMKRNVRGKRKFLCLIPLKKMRQSVPPLGKLWRPKKAHFHSINKLSGRLKEKYVAPLLTSLQILGIIALPIRTTRCLFHNFFTPSEGGTQN